MDTGGFQSPPKPRRILAIAPTNQAPVARFPVQETGCPQPRSPETPRPSPVTASSSELLGKKIDEVEGKIVEHVVCDLPNVFDEVFSMQKGQSNEIQRQQQALQDVQTKIAEVEERNTKLREEISCITNRLYMAQEQICRSSKTIKSYSEELKDLSVDVYDAELQLEKATDDYNAENRRFGRLKETTVRHAETVRQYERDSTAVGQELLAVEQNIQTLQKQKSEIDNLQETTQRVLTGDGEREVETEIAELKHKLETTKQDQENKRIKITEEQKKQKQLNQTTQVLHKRNAAQLTRLRRQLKDVQQRNRQWSSQVAQLEAKIAEAKHRLTEQA